MLYRPATRWVYSYGEHFPLAAAHVRAAAERPVVLVIATVVSSTTARHQSLVMSTARARGIPVFRVTDHLLAPFSSDNRRGYNANPCMTVAERHATNINTMVAAAHAAAKQVYRMRGDFLPRADAALAHAGQQLREARRYARLFDLVHMLPEDMPEDDTESLMLWACGGKRLDGRERFVLSLMRHRAAPGALQQAA